MTFDEVLDQVRELLEREGRVDYSLLRLLSVTLKGAAAIEAEP